jgi:hypothetical protein
MLTWLGSDQFDGALACVYVTASSESDSKNGVVVRAAPYSEQFFARTESNTTSKTFGDRLRPIPLVTAADCLFLSNIVYNGTVFLPNSLERYREELSAMKWF